MGDAGRHDGDLAGLIQALFPPDPDHDRGSADLEPLLLVGMDMRSRDESAGRQVQVELEQLAAGIA
jgi:hypothetical protein